MTPTQSPSDAYILRLEEQLAEALHREKVAVDAYLAQRDRYDLLRAALKCLLETHAP